MIIRLAAAALFTCLSVGFADANSDDAKWIAQCLKDNADAKVDVSIVQKYCGCMNNKMDANETQSITAWEKTHVAERKACDQEAGWN